MAKSKKKTAKSRVKISAGLCVLLFGIVFGAHSWRSHRTIPEYVPPVIGASRGQELSGNSFMVVAAGDIACSSKSDTYNNGAGTANACHMQATASLVRKLKPDLVLLLGDNQYEKGELDEYQKVFGASWGAADIKAITKPVPGNHEYNTKGASGYYSYFGTAAGDPAKGYYSFDRGSWHFVALNSNCSAVLCKAGSPQQIWLEQDLAANQSKCILAYWHHPLFSSATHGNNPEVRALYQTLVRAHADIVLNGHDHVYERFALQNADGAADPLGIRNFTVGTGGKNFYPFRDLKPNSQVRIGSAYGVIRLVMGENGYQWEFIDENGQARDRGSASCLN